MVQKTKPDTFLVEMLGVGNVKSAPDLVAVIGNLFPDALTILFGLKKSATLEINGKRLASLASFVSSLCGIAESMADMQNRVALARKSVPMLRESHKRFGQASTAVRHCLDELSRVRDLLECEKKDLVPGTLNLGRCKKELRNLHKTVKELQADGAALVTPALRTKKENILARASNLSKSIGTLPVTEGSAAINYQVVEVVEKLVRRIWGKEIKLQCIDKFNVKFLAMMGVTITEENAKTMRLRNNKHSRMSS